VQELISDPKKIKEIAEDPRLVRAILSETRLLTIDGAAAVLGISPYRVKILRGRRVTLDQGTTGPYLPRADAMPRSLPIPGNPLWTMEEIQTWGKQSGRLDMDGNPQRARPSGRPRRA